MYFRSAVLSAMLCNSAVARISEFTTSLQSGKKLMSNSRRLDGEDDLSWMTDYSIIFEGCSSIAQFDEEGGGEEDEGKVSYQGLAKFRLCPSGKCSTSCSKGGKYMTDMNQFMQTYLEYQEEMKQAACESVQENCDCENANDDEVCEQQCYADAGLDYCIEEENDDDKYEAFDIQDFMECRQIEDGADDDSVSYYVGPKCSSNGKNVYLQVYTNERCTVEASSGDTVFQGIYGQSLPYSSQSIISHDCISCLQVAENDDDDNVEVAEICNGMYEEAAKCETNLDVAYPSTADCDFMSSSSSQNVKYTKSYAAKTFSCTFAMTTAVLGYYAFTLRKKLERADVKLNDDIVGEMS